MDIDVNFSPNDEEAIGQFFEDLRDLSEKEIVEAHELLNEPQAEAVTEALEDLVINGEKTGEDEGEEVNDGPSTQINREQNVSETATVWARHWCTGHKVWELELKVEWDYMIGDLMAVTKTPDSTVHDSTWTDNGTSTAWLHDEDDAGMDENEWEAYHQHQFQYLGGGPVPSVGYSPYIHMKGGDYWPAEIVDKHENLSDNACIVW